MVVWLLKQLSERVYPYCEIREVRGRDDKKYELVVTYRLNVHHVERFADLGEAERRAAEWEQLWSQSCGGNASGDREQPQSVF